MTKHFEKKVDVALKLKTNVNAEHAASFDSKSRGILAAIITIVCLLLTLFLPSLSYLIRVTIAIIILVMMLVLIFNNKVRYSVIMFLRQLDQKLAARKTYGDKKPANHDD